MSEPALRAERLGKTALGADGPIEILKSVSFSAHVGESVALVGPSGSGKSTLLSLLAGLDSPTSGDAFIMGRSIASASEDQRAALRREHTSFVFQSFQLLSHLSALENVEFGLEVQGRPDRAFALKCLESVGMGARARHLPKTLSGGEQQRVALARALAARPRILFADEPTGSLDRANGARVEDALFNLAKEEGCCLIVVTHDERLARRADRVIELFDGSARERGERL